MASPTNLPTLSILHLDDDPFERERVQTALEQHPVSCRFKVKSVATVAEYRKELTATRPDLVILDIHVQDDKTTGISLASETRKASPKAVILMCSTADDISTIAECLAAGADDFLSKLTDKGEMSLRVFNSYRLSKLKQGGETPFSTPAPVDPNRRRPVGATMEKITRRIPLITDSAITAVFIRGESGTGKEVVADLVGQALETKAPFVKVNCGAIAPTLLESELFGHVKGAFTGASNDKRGLLEAASGGWIFLDEVATLSQSAQVAMLRVLENQEVLRVGSTKPVSITVRVLSATNEPLEKLVKEGKFRGDLWQRLREAEITLPPLRERPEEIPALVEHFCKTMPGGPYKVSGPVMEVLTNVSWKEGNIRELRNCLRAMTEMHVNKLLTPLAIPERVWEEIGEKPDPSLASPTEAPRPDAGPAPKRASSGDLVLPWDRSEAQSYDYLSDVLLLEMTKKLAQEKGKLTLRGLALAIGMSRSTLSGRLKAIVHRNIIDLTEMSKLVGISEK